MTDTKDLFFLTNEQTDILRPFFPIPRGKPRVNDKLVLSGILFVLRNGGRWRDAPDDYGSHKTLYTRWRRWAQAGIFFRMLWELSKENAEVGTMIMDSTSIRAQRTACSLKLREGVARLIGSSRGGRNTKLHATCDAEGRLCDIFLTRGEASDYKGADVLLRTAQRGEMVFGRQRMRCGLGSQPIGKHRNYSGYSPQEEPDKGDLL